ncbi:MAG TPA: hypothetical protein PKD49_06320 [Hyphomicrobium sp.]|nr:hypothetical protein [Hyphomicrobium sp.]
MSKTVTSARKYDPRYVVAEFTPTGAMIYSGLTEAGLQVVEDAAAEGLSHESIATLLGIRTASWADVRRRHQDAMEAFVAGRARYDTKLKRQLNKHIDEGNLTGIIWGMKSILGYREVGPADGSNPAAANINITINAPMGDDEWKKMIDVTPEDK